jgi:YVTN family beta-propeller protein
VFVSLDQTAFVTNQAANTVSVIDVENHVKLKDVAIGSKPNGLVFKP